MAGQKPVGESGSYLPSCRCPCDAHVRPRRKGRLATFNLPPGERRIILSSTFCLGVANSSFAMSRGHKSNLGMRTLSGDAINSEAAMNPVDSNPAWGHIISLLFEASTESTNVRGERSYGRNRKKQASIPWPDDVKIRVLDRVSAKSVSITWCHPCSGYYGSQVWREAVARTSGVCALSGEPVARGDRIYRLARTHQNPSNALAVLLASQVDAILDRRQKLDDDSEYEEVCQPDRDPCRRVAGLRAGS